MHVVFYFRKMSCLSIGACMMSCFKLVVDRFGLIMQLIPSVGPDTYWIFDLLSFNKAASFDVGLLFKIIFV